MIDIDIHLENMFNPVTLSWLLPDFAIWKACCCRCHVAIAGKYSRQALQQVHQQLEGMETTSGFHQAVRQGPECLRRPNSLDVCLVFDIDPRNLLGMSPSQCTSQMTAAELAKLIYRDNMEVKHGSRKRLAQEISDKMTGIGADQVDESKKNKPGLGGPLTRALKDYLVHVAWPPIVLMCQLTVV